MLANLFFASTHHSCLHGRSSLPDPEVDASSAFSQPSAPWLLRTWTHHVSSVSRTARAPIGACASPSRATAVRNRKACFIPNNDGNKKASARLHGGLCPE